MPSLKPRAFMSYAHIDNKYGQLTEFRDRLSNEVHVQTGEAFPIFQDRDDILLGQTWHQRIKEALQKEVTFLIPILTPSFFKSDACREELTVFLDRERSLKRNDLIFPMYYIGCRVLEDERLRASDQLGTAIAARQWADWRGLRFEPFESPQSCKAIMQIASQISATIDRIASESREIEVPDLAADEVGQREGESSRTLSLFISYSHADERIADQLLKHLKVLQREGVIDVWHDRIISAGDQWFGQISDALERAQIVLFLVSADFLASDYCYDVEVRRALERHATGEAVVIPVILRACDWGGSLFSKFQALPSDGRPITISPNRDKALMDVVRGVRAAATLLSKQKPPNPALQRRPARRRR
ncbi:MAG: toll/interleukin-1 receptor domain-containing protein [Blastocatellia bacterium]